MESINGDDTRISTEPRSSPMGCDGQPRTWRRPGSAQGTVRRGWCHSCVVTEQHSCASKAREPLSTLRGACSQARRTEKRTVDTDRAQYLRNQEDVVRSVP